MTDTDTRFDLLREIVAAVDDDHMSKSRALRMAHLITTPDRVEPHLSDVKPSGAVEEQLEGSSWAGNSYAVPLLTYAGADKPRTDANELPEAPKKGELSSRVCEREGCDNRLRRSSGESAAQFKRRRFCSRGCSRMVLKGRTRRPKKKAGEPEPTEPEKAAPLESAAEREKTIANPLEHPTELTPPQSLRHLPDPRADHWESVRAPADDSAPRCEVHGEVLGAYGCTACNAAKKYREQPRRAKIL